MTSITANPPPVPSRTPGAAHSATRSPATAHSSAEGQSSVAAQSPAEVRSSVAAQPASPADASLPQSTVVRREDYRAPDWQVDSVVLHFCLDADNTVVTAACQYRRRPEAPADALLRLDGEALETLAVAVNDIRLPSPESLIENGQLVLRDLPEHFVLHTQVRIHPAANLELSGLYATQGTLLTQCEAQGFRRMTWFMDRPDVMSTFRVILQARRADYPVLLSNGNLLADDAPAAREARAALSVLPCGPATLAGTASAGGGSGGSVADAAVGGAGAGAGAGAGRDAAAGTEWHEVVWEDPFRKPCYLFALVAGKLAVNETRYRLASGREVLLQVWTRPEEIHRTGFALQSLEKAIAWDERRFGLELDLDRFMIVAAPDFNMGAMENKGLNIFNAKYVFADPFVATDTDFEWIESIIGHEYFHNWTGNRVTCRDWFQLTLKEGLTVFRDQEFTADQMAAGVAPQAAGSVRALQRMDNVRLLRQVQFAEDAGPMRHPIRPDSYQAIDNFYTATVYEKGSEVIRMLQTLLGVDGFRRGMDLYFERHDGQAVTCEAFVSAMADANGRDLGQFMRWYGTPGTPRLVVRSHYDAATKRLVLSLTQQLPDTDGNPVTPPAEKALHIPVNVALLARGAGSAGSAGAAGSAGSAAGVAGVAGAAGAAGAQGTAGGRLHGAAAGSVIAQRLLELKTPSQDFVFEGVESVDARGPILSLLRDFSAPVVVDFPATDADLAFLLQHDDNLFNRWEAGQQLAERALLAAVRGSAPAADTGIPSGGVTSSADSAVTGVSTSAGSALPTGGSTPSAGTARDSLQALADALMASLPDARLDDGLRQQMLLLPDELRLAEQLTPLDPQRLRTRRNEAVLRIVQPLVPWLRQVAERRHWQAPYSLDVPKVGQRALGNTALQLLTLAGADGAAGLARAQFDGANNLTDRLGALQALLRAGADDAEWALARFEEVYRDETHVLDKWFTAQATMHGTHEPTLARVKRLMAHPGWDAQNPNKVRALLYAFFNSNLAEFHRPDGEGYALWLEQVLRLDRSNPQVAARMARTLNRHRRFVPALADRMQAVLAQAAQDAQSPDVREVIAKELES